MTSVSTHVYNSITMLVHADVIFLDFAKAFDTVSHVKLVSKLKAHGIEGNLLQWIIEWLHQRVQRGVV